ncbi:hypothetical protein SK571_25960 [Lentzea sp. BCCO 10_0798]|uniref:Uncharacterized protein n=1 Tax=Lentzea kristufekii TaxID=3095430 RepID=A0ABU4TWY2_9PSEU|nr:hypothetical protein [Lentzea sp. BCCO 10_0798]MDX8052838.1 hypothetical protein [Lentzea sp. BCCO 10_0798]
MYCDAEFSEWAEYAGSSTEFLHDLLTGEVESELDEYGPPYDLTFAAPPQRQPG